MFVYYAFSGNNFSVLLPLGLLATSSRSGDFRKHNFADFRYVYFSSHLKYHVCTIIFGFVKWKQKVSVECPSVLGLKGCRA